MIECPKRASAVTIALEDPSSPAAQACIARYFRELDERFEGGFNPGASITATPQELTPPSGYFLVAWMADDPIGCGALKCHPDFGEIKRMWVNPSARGLGIGWRILLRLETIALERNLPLLRLETNKALVEAHALYRRSGFREVAPFNVEPYAHLWFEKVLSRP